MQEQEIFGSRLRQPTLVRSVSGACDSHALPFGAADNCCP
jgi:hypothetical protein